MDNNRSNPPPGGNPSSALALQLITTAQAQPRPYPSSVPARAVISHSIPEFVEGIHRYLEGITAQHNYIQSVGIDYTRRLNETRMALQAAEDQLVLVKKDLDTAVHIGKGMEKNNQSLAMSLESERAAHSEQYQHIVHGRLLAQQRADRLEKLLADALAKNEAMARSEEEQRQSHVEEVQKLGGEIEQLKEENAKKASNTPSSSSGQASQDLSRVVPDYTLSSIRWFQREREAFRDASKKLEEQRDKLFQDQQLPVELEASKERIKSLQNLVETVQTQRQQLESSLSDERSARSEQEKELGKKIDDSKALQARFDAETKRSSELKDRVNVLEAEEADRQQALRSAIEGLKESEVQLSKHKAEIERLEVLVSALKKKEIEEQTMVAKLREDLAKSHSDGAATTTSLNDTQRQLQELRETLSTTKAEVSQKEEDAERLRAQLCKAELERDAVAQGLTLVQAELKEEQQALVAAKADVAYRGSRINELVSQAAKIQAELDKALVKPAKEVIDLSKDDEDESTPQTSTQKSIGKKVVTPASQKVKVDVPSPTVPSTSSDGRRKEVDVLPSQNKGSDRRNVVSKTPSQTPSTSNASKPNEPSALRKSLNASSITPRGTHGLPPKPRPSSSLAFNMPKVTKLAQSTTPTSSSTPKAKPTNSSQKPRPSMGGDSSKGSASATSISAPVAKLSEPTKQRDAPTAKPPNPLPMPTSQRDASTASATSTPTTTNSISAPRPRMKVTARKSTGGTAPRKLLTPPASAHPYHLAKEKLQKDGHATGDQLSRKSSTSTSVASTSSSTPSKQVPRSAEELRAYIATIPSTSKNLAKRKQPADGVVEGGSHKRKRMKHTGGNGNGA